MRNNWKPGETFGDAELNELLGAVMDHGTEISELKDAPQAQDGHTPDIDMVGDQIAVDGAIIGPHLTGPKGADSTVPGPKGEDSTVPGPPGPPGKDGQDGDSPDIDMVGDQLAIDGEVTGPHLTGPEGPMGKNAAVLFVDDLSEVPAGTPADTLVVVR